VKRLPSPKGLFASFCKIALRVCDLVTVLTALAACPGKSPETAGATRGKEAVHVKVAAAAVKTVPLAIQAISHAEAHTTVAVKARVDGR
jgi:hypothetical protein